MQFPCVVETGQKSIDSHMIFDIPTPYYRKRGAI